MKTQTDKKSEIVSEVIERIDELAGAGQISGQVAYYLKNGHYPSVPCMYCGRGELDPEYPICTACEE